MGMDDLTHQPSSQQTLVLFASGSLSQAFKKIAEAFHADQGVPVKTEFGSTARMEKLICEGAACDVFASADIEISQKFVNAGKAAKVIPFAQNDIVVVTGGNPQMTTDNLVKTLKRAPHLKIGISDPATQPCGAKALESLSLLLPAGDLKKRLRIVTGGLDKKTEKAPGAKSDYTVALEEKVDLLVVFRTTALKVCQQSGQARIVGLPQGMQVKSLYGAVVLNKDNPASQDFVECLKSKSSADIFIQYGFKLP